MTLHVIKKSNKRFSLLLPNFHANYLQVLKAAVKYHGAYDLAVSFAKIDLEESEEKQKVAIATVIKDAVLTQHAQTIILSSSYLAKYQDYAQEIINTTNNDVTVLLPLAESIRYIEKILNGSESYDKGNLLPPDPEGCAVV